ncbi:hypothetical protein [Kangiella koreensis]|uniref:Lipoprotein n=1 Tax=Kangiella koreensis (strain DSM 16069 / JCM 12317 / KCTC 12182 / SW-125) TaxID=523791 RepID=C7RB06_KANKD|nr:hypothetical protein [Kangiella koreensis]ACV26448.1 conserved hypothetical protein [Kangiella koreensis DSM 16069]
MSFKTLLAMVSTVLLASACKTIEPDQAKPAVITNPSAETTAELTKVVSTIYNGRPVTLAQDVLTDTNILSIQIAEHKKDGLPVRGRIEEMPRQFQLLKHEDDCYLYDSQNDTLYPLSTVQCETIELP